MFDIIFPALESVPMPITTIIVMLIAFFGSFIGGITGVGGGMIIKPMLGNMLGMAVTTISLYASKFISTSVVLSMSIRTSTIYKRDGFDYDIKLFVRISIGLVLGILSVDLIPVEITPAIETILQGILYTLVFVSVLLREKYPKLNYVDNTIMAIIVGFVIGFLSSFFGIGGGAIKVPFFIIFFSMPVSQAAIYSFLVSIVTEPLKLIQYGTHLIDDTSSVEILFPVVIISLLCVPAAIMGATLGVSIQKKSSDRFIANAFNTVVMYFAITSFISGISIMKGNGTVTLVDIITRIFNN